MSDKRRQDRQGRCVPSRWPRLSKCSSMNLPNRLQTYRQRQVKPISVSSLPRGHPRRVEAHQPGMRRPPGRLHLHLELSLRMVRALPNASRMGFDCSTLSVTAPTHPDRQTTGAPKVRPPRHTISTAAHALGAMTDSLLHDGVGGIGLGALGRAHRGQVLHHHLGRLRLASTCVRTTPPPLHTHLLLPATPPAQANGASTAGVGGVDQ